jgi:hypothetical protein
LEIIIDCHYLNKTPFVIDNENGLSAFQKVILKKKTLMHWRRQRIFSEATGRKTSLTVITCFYLESAKPVK